MRLIVDNRIRFRKDRLPKGTLTAIKKAFRHNNPQYFKMKNMGYYTGKTPRVIGTFTVDKNGTWVTVPRGGMDRILEILEPHGIETEIIDRRIDTTPVDFAMDPNFKLRPYQKEAVAAILEAETCLIEGAPASGKTEILYAAMTQAGGRAGVLVHDRNLFNQWVKRATDRLQIPSKEVGRVGLGKFKLGKRITIMMQQTARNKIDQLSDYFDFLAADEAHHYSANTFTQTIDSFGARWRVGVSARIKRQDLTHFLIHDLFGKIVFSIDRDELVELGYTTEIELNIVHTEFEYDYMNLAALEDHFSTRFQDFEDLTAKERREVANDLEIEPKDYPQYLDASSADSDRNNLIYQWVKREFDRGSTSVIFTKRREQCQLWADRLKKLGLECVIFWGAGGKVKEEKRIQKDLKRLKSKEVRIAIGTTIDEGIDMPAVDVGFITYRNAGNVGQLEQQAGRLARLFIGKDVGRLYYFHDKNIDGFAKDQARLVKQFNKVRIHEKTRKRKKIRQ